jgi:DNA primase large subunit
MKVKNFKIKESSKNGKRKVLVLNLKKSKRSNNDVGENGNSQQSIVSHLFQKHLTKSSNILNEDSIDVISSYLKAPMKDCLRLMESYSIEMYRGSGHINYESGLSVLKTIFDRNFRKENQKIKKNMSNLTKGNLDFKMIINSLREHKQIRMEGEKPTKMSGMKFQANIRDIEYFAQNHFPLCMYEMYRSFKKEKHLKHSGRLQLILFIKGLGFKVEEVISFFKSVVSKGPSSKKIKEYEYMIKHSFGLVGSKTEYSGMGCPKIMSNSRPSKGDVHGCPFNYYGQNSLEKLLMHKLGNEKEVQDIMESNSMGAKFGCRSFFCKKNKLRDIEDVDDGIGRHPNIYFNVSYFRKGRKRDFKKKEDKPNGLTSSQSNKIQIEMTS